MTAEQEERLVAAFENIANALMGIHETGQKQFAKQWPERGTARDAVKTRIPTEEDRIREKHGTSSESIEEWLSTPEEKFFGNREREFIKQKIAPHGTQTAGEGGPEDGSAETPES